jgi:23S rRNA (cytidine1920-2'-O)/16S rRNA (cytidine1409-2'-O)-methyltransferase
VRRRLDVEMVRRGIVASRSEASEAIRSGKVAVAGRPATKSGTLVTPDEHIALTGPSRRFVSRGGEKLEAALDRFRVDVAGRRALDAGASTGGFTDCLLSRGTAHVIALDVGYGQLDWRLRQDPRVTVLERTNIRDVEPEALPYLADLVVADLSFISLATALPSLVSSSASGAVFVLLVKPQFEAGREDVGSGGVVSDPNAWRRAVGSVVRACEEEGVRPTGVMASPLLGPAGNVEFFLHGERVTETTTDRSRHGGRPLEAGSGSGLDPAIEAAVSQGLSLRGLGIATKGEAHRAGR